MRYRSLGRTGLTVSEIGLGTWAFAAQAYGAVDRRQALATVRAALDEGITFFDTAPLYGNAQHDGVAESLLGTAIGRSRDDVVIATKFGRRSTRPDTEFSAAGCRQSVEESLRRLGTDRIDVLFFHSPFSADQIHDDIWGALNELKDSGKIGVVGHSVSLLDATAPLALAWSADRKIGAVQVVYSLLNREAAGLMQVLAERGIGIVARESLANGFLSGTVTRETVFPPDNLNSRYGPEEIAERVDQVERLSFLVQPPIRSMPQAAMRWALDNPAVSVVLTGATSIDQLAECAEVSELPSYSEEDLRLADKRHTKDFSAA